MGRWRPKGKPASKYITPEGYRRLNEELQRLWKEERPPITKSVQEAAAQGDRSENAEYIYGKKQLREIDRRIRFLSKRLDGMNVVERAPEDTGKVFFGAWVEVEDDDGKVERFRLVGPDEADGSRGETAADADAGGREGARARRAAVGDRSEGEHSCPSIIGRRSAPAGSRVVEA